jgi:archaellum component FlaF (FlaF/FlaG flagellin family)
MDDTILDTITHGFSVVMSSVILIVLLYITCGMAYQANIKNCAGRTKKHNNKPMPASLSEKIASFSTAGLIITANIIWTRRLLE